jgi:hypothetical protein
VAPGDRAHGGRRPPVPYPKTALACLLLAGSENSEASDVAAGLQPAN